MTRYLSGLCVAGLGLCGGGWLLVASAVFGEGSPGQAGRVNLLTGAGLVAVSCLSIGCWAVAWRRRMRMDGVLSDRFPWVSRREARRNRRQLSRDVGRTARLAKRSARDARRTARRTARLTGEGVLSSGADVGSALGGDGPYSVAMPPGEAGTGAVAGAAGMNGESAAELLSELRDMLVPLLNAAGQRPGGGQPDPSASSAPTAASGGPGVPLSPAVAASPRSGVPASPPPALPRQLPRRIPRPGFASASAFSFSSAPLDVPSGPPASSPAAGDDPLFAGDGEEAWW